MHSAQRFWLSRTFWSVQILPKQPKALPPETIPGLKIYQKLIVGFGEPLHNVNVRENREKERGEKKGEGENGEGNGNTLFFHKFSLKLGPGPHVALHSARQT